MVAKAGGAEGDGVGAQRGRWQSVLALALLALYTIFFYRDLLFGGRVYVFRDMYTLLLSYEHSARLFARWHWLPLWNPFAVLGKPFAADPITGVFYPLNWGLRRLPEARGVNLSIALHHFIAAAGLFALLRFHRIGVMAALLGALVFGFGGMLVSLDNILNGLQSAAWLPWSILGFEVWCERRSPAAVAAMALALGMTLLGAMPEFWFFANAVTIARAIDRARSNGEPRLLQSLSTLLIANTMALGVCALQVAPLAEYVLHSSRSAGLRAEGVTTYSLHPLGLLAFLLPRHYVEPNGQFHETAGLWEGTFTAAPLVLSLYVGVMLTLLVPALGRLTRAQRWWWISIGVAFSTLALGKYLPGYAWLVDHLVFLRVVRYPEKFLMVVHGLLGAGVGIGLEHAMRQPGHFRAVALAGAVLACVALVTHGIIATVATNFPVLLLADDLRTLAVLCGLIAAIALGARRHPRVGAAALLLLAAFDLYRVNATLLPSVPADALLRVPRSVEIMQRGDEPLRIYSDGLGRPPVPSFPDSFIQEQNLLLTHDAAYYSIDNLNAPATINLSDHERLEEIIEHASRERLAAIFAALNVRYVTSSKELQYPGLRLVQSPRDVLEVYVYEVEAPTPRAFVPRRLRAVETTEQAIESLRDGVDPSAEVAVEARTLPAGLDPSMNGTVRVTSYLPERVELLAQLQTPGLVVLTDSYYPGWEASVDGAPTAIVRANYFARGVYVAAGEHRIVFRYAPLSYRLGVAVSATVCVLLLVGLMRAARQRRGRP